MAKEKKRGESYRIPDHAIKDFLEQFRVCIQDNISPFKNFGRINFEVFPAIFLSLSVPEQRVLCTLMRRMASRNLVTLTRTQLSKWMYEDYSKSSSLNHLSEWLKDMQAREALKEVDRSAASPNAQDREDVVIYCINPAMVFKGPNKEHIRAILEWDDDAITLPGKRRKQTKLIDHTPKSEKGEA